ncbi:MAG: iron ABC transporter permease [Planctomycetes bacterium]|nr:iron ABC transporter permease [Planctomycetota bacterium]
MTAASRPAPFSRERFVRVLAAGVIVALVAVAASLAFGAERVDAFAVLTGGGTQVEREILLSLRLPRVLTGALVGAGLAAAGVAFQALLRNPLAEPYLLGISGGGSLGAVLSIVLLGAGGAGFLAVRTVAALVGCLVALWLVYAIATRGGTLRPATLLLAGVVVNSFFLAGLACVQFAATPTESQAILRWVLGGLETGGPREVVVLAIVVPAGIALLGRWSPSLHALVFGEETARHLGVDVDGVRRRTFVVASAVTAASVAVAGPIGFVGLVVPHAVRMFVGSDPRMLLPASALAGAAFLPIADAAARTALAPREMPVGVVTAMIGAPAFLLLIVRRSERGVGETVGGTESFRG